jgi:hypothetical protein
MYVTANFGDSHLAGAFPKIQLAQGAKLLATGTNSC